LGVVVKDKKEHMVSQGKDFATHIWFSILSFYRFGYRSLKLLNLLSTEHSVAEAVQSRRSDQRLKIPLL
jgi:hypothetical protein